MIEREQPIARGPRHQSRAIERGELLGSLARVARIDAAQDSPQVAAHIRATRDGQPRVHDVARHRLGRQPSNGDRKPMHGPQAQGLGDEPH